MYRTNEFQMWVVVDGNEQRITSKSLVYIDFDKEYAIRVRNNTLQRAKFEIAIDGVSTNDQYVISPFDTVTIERFLNGDLSRGQKFKFVRLDNPDVQDPGSLSNGEVAVKIWKEKVPSFDVIYFPEPTQVNTWPGILYSHSTTPVSASYYSTPCLNNVSFCCNSSPNGATVDGSNSTQQFVSVDDFEVEAKPIILKVSLRGKEKETISWKVTEKVKIGQRINGVMHIFCEGCGKPYPVFRDYDIKFCSNCGKQLRD